LNQITKTLYPAFTQSNFENYVKSAKARRPIVDEQGKIHRGATFWSKVNFDGFVLPAQGQSKPYCKKWISYGCNNTKQHPNLVKLLIVQNVLCHGLIDKQIEALEDL